MKPRLKLVMILSWLLAVVFLNACETAFDPPVEVSVPVTIENTSDTGAVHIISHWETFDLKPGEQAETLISPSNKLLPKQRREITGSLIWYSEGDLYIVRAYACKNGKIIASGSKGMTFEEYTFIKNNNRKLNVYIGWEDPKYLMVSIMAQ